MQWRAYIADSESRASEMRRAPAQTIVIAPPRAFLRICQSPEAPASGNTRPDREHLQEFTPLRWLRCLTVVARAC
jgi:hypothetical protein